MDAAEKIIRYLVDYSVGSIVRRPSGLYKCYNAITANPTWLPENTAAHWEPITVGEDGTIDNPITAAAGMRYFKDKYYLDGGKTYKFIRDALFHNGDIRRGLLPANILSSKLISC